MRWLVLSIVRGVYEQFNIMKKCVDDWTAERRSLLVIGGYLSLDLVDIEWTLFLCLECESRHNETDQGPVSKEQRKNGSTILPLCWRTLPSCS